MKPSLILIASLLIAGSAAAHITLDQREAEAGSVYKAVLKVGHGCEGSPTRAITVLLPPGFKGANPVPKAGWTLKLRMEKLAQPYESHGKPVTEGLAEVSWTANTEADWLQDAWYDEFVVRGTLPAEAGALWFKVRQTCAQGESNWAAVPAEGTSTRGLKSPAALLLVTPKK
ncbi:YcnI family protein [Pelomonas sp. V22]|uniref:YcnI family copper-binding membrane protein n=1 Tax=Pelomonas sp. V22 TaxID=2822139 RepID=UPI0024A98A36|nr:YcnI family protein [Pelomonas sp. V22]MDI4635398.1 YcnI family protein [Pelomonas sp. V22]